MAYFLRYFLYFISSLSSKSLCVKFHDIMNFSTFAQKLKKLEDTSSRLDMTAQLADLFNQLRQQEIPAACYLMQGELVPRYRSLEFNMSNKLTMRAIAQLLAKRNPDSELPDINLFQEADYTHFQQRVESAFDQEGDLGLVAQKLLKEANDTEETELLAVYQQLVNIAQEAGEGSQERKINQTKQLLDTLSPLGMRYAVRIIIGKLRLGFSTMTMLDALSWAQHEDKRDRQRLELAYNKRADIGALAQGYLQASSQQELDQFLQSYQVQVGVPVVPALCQRLNTTQEIIDKMGAVLVEPKYDGLRAQIHIDCQGIEQRPGVTAGVTVSEQRPGLAVSDQQARTCNNGQNAKQVQHQQEQHQHQQERHQKQCQKQYQVYTRNLDNVTHMFPELDEAMASLNCQQCILDAEVIAYDQDTGELLPFQQTVTRRRKHGVANQAELTPVRFYVFDVLLKDQQPLIDHKLKQRRQVLAELFAPNPVLKVTEYIQTNDPDELRSYHRQELSAGLEGAVIKRLDSRYRGGRKGWRWVKLKEPEGTEGKLSDTLDCVVMGYYHGKGKRAEFGIGAFLVGILASDEVEEVEKDQSSSVQEISIKTVAKIGTGLTDEQFKQIKTMADQVKSSEKPKTYNVPEELEPDVWVEPEIVVEIAADELTDSPLHSAGQALRFPRLIRFRPDKDWQQATTITELENIRVA